MLRVGFALEVFKVLEGEEAGERDAEGLDTLAAAVLLPVHEHQRVAHVETGRAGLRDSIDRRLAGGEHIVHDQHTVPRLEGAFHRVLHPVVLGLLADHEGPQLTARAVVHVVGHRGGDRDRADLHPAHSLDLPAPEMVGDQLGEDPPVLRVREQSLAVDVVLADAAGRQRELRRRLPVKGAGLEDGLGEVELAHSWRVRTITCRSESSETRFMVSSTPSMHDVKQLEIVMRYHQETKHHFNRYARALGHLDWANQPNPFRRYEGATLVRLPLLGLDEEPLAPPYEDLYRPVAMPSAPVTIRTLSRLFEYALALSAWKPAGGTRWALRSNTSSGNLHPTEGYLLIGAVSGLAATPGLYHYAPKEHGLERRADCPAELFAELLHEFPPQAFLVGLSSIHWREAWKYGERAFRYCQHDAGHAIGTLRIAAATLGWSARVLDDVADATIEALLGLDRDADFEGAERESAELVMALWPGNTVSATLKLELEAVRELARQRTASSSSLRVADTVFPGHSAITSSALSRSAPSKSASRSRPSSASMVASATSSSTRADQPSVAAAIRSVPIAWPASCWQ